MSRAGREEFNEKECNAYTQSYNLGTEAFQNNKTSDYKKDKRFMEILESSEEKWRKEMIRCWRFSYKLERGY
jgi:hypothetical protein